VNVGWKRFVSLISRKHPFPTIRQAIVKMDTSILTVGNAISLLKLLPTEDEVIVITFVMSSNSNI
jgi:hypothetical protein